MENKAFGVIFDIEPEKFILEGEIYINEDLTKLEEEKDESIISLFSNRINQFRFDNVISKIVQESNEAEKESTVKSRNKEFDDFFKKNAGRTLDLIFFGKDGFRGIEKTILEETAIFYIKIAENVKLGFLINKKIAELLFESGDY